MEKYRRPGTSLAGITPLPDRKPDSVPLKEVYREIKRHPLGELALKHFYPETKALELTAGAADDPKLAEKLAPLIEEAWTRARTLAQGGTYAAGKELAELIRRLAQRTGLHAVSPDTGTSPYQDLQLDVQKLPQEIAYRITWGISKLPEFVNPDGVRWTPTAYFQLGPGNQEFIRGFMEVQFTSERVVVAPEIPGGEKPVKPSRSPGRIH